MAEGGTGCRENDGACVTDSVCHTTATVNATVTLVPVRFLLRRSHLFVSDASPRSACTPEKWSQGRAARAERIFWPPRPKKCESALALKRCRFILDSIFRACHRDQPTRHVPGPTNQWTKNARHGAPLSRPSYQPCGLLQWQPDPSGALPRASLQKHQQSPARSTRRAGFVQDRSDLVQNRSALCGNRSCLVQNRSSLAQNRSGVYRNRSSLRGNRSGLCRNRSGLVQNRSGLPATRSHLPANRSGLVRIRPVRAHVDTIAHVAQDFWQALALFNQNRRGT